MKPGKCPLRSQEAGLKTLWQHQEQVRLLTYCWKDNLLIKLYMSSWDMRVSGLIYCLCSIVPNSDILPLYCIRRTRLTGGCCEKFRTTLSHPVFSSMEYMLKLRHLEDWHYRSVIGSTVLQVILTYMTHHITYTCQSFAYCNAGKAMKVFFLFQSLSANADVQQDVEALAKLIKSYRRQIFWAFGHSANAQVFLSSTQKPLLPLVHFPIFARTWNKTPLMSDPVPHRTVIQPM